MSTTDAAGAQHLRTMFEWMVLSRTYEERLAKAYLEGKTPIFSMAAGPIPGEMHLSNGQEPCAAGVCIHLSISDVVTATHRPHHVAIAKGVDLERMTAEIFGRRTGLGGGKGGHMHLFAPEVGFSCSGIVGQGIGLAAGHALAAKMKRTGGVAVAFTGEGAANQGIFHETMNLAGLWKLPFICVIEDNRWGVSVSKKQSTAVERNSDRASAYGIVGEHVAGNDLRAVYSAAARAVRRARAGEGATIIEIETERLAGHFVGDPQTYVPKHQLAEQRDPIQVEAARLQADGVMTAAEIDAVRVRAGERVGRAFEYAVASPLPDPSEALEAVYA
jgi:pyruvate dehydrogenase E1 component alpha subunit